MEYLTIIVFVFVVSVLVILGARNYYVNQKLKKIIIEKYYVVKPLIEKIQAQQKVTHDEILGMSKDPSLRYAVFKILQAHGKTHLFPNEYYTIEKASESLLVNWLEFPTELGFVPDHIQFEAIITLAAEPEAINYYVFKFIVSKPPWPAKDWMIGVCGPFNEKSVPYDVPTRIFSRFNVIGSISLESEVLWVHENVRPNMKQKRNSPN
jgi:hypothetical protein